MLGKNVLWPILTPTSGAISYHLLYLQQSTHHQVRNTLEDEILVTFIRSPPMVKNVQVWITKAQVESIRPLPIAIQKDAFANIEMCSA